MKFGIKSGSVKHDGGKRERVCVKENQWANFFLNEGLKIWNRERYLHSSVSVSCYKWAKLYPQSFIPKALSPLMRSRDYELAYCKKEQNASLYTHSLNFILLNCIGGKNTLRTKTKSAVAGRSHVQRGTYSRSQEQKGRPCMGWSEVHTSQICRYIRGTARFEVN